MLQKFKQFSVKQLAQMIESLDPLSLNADTAGTLIHNLPEPQDVKRYQNYQGSVEQLADRVDQYFYYLSKIPRLRIRLQACVSQTEIPDKIIQIRVKVQLFEIGCETLKSNESFKNFLVAVLTLGNRMNEGTNKGNATGFKLTSLPSLLNVKSEQ